MHAQKKRCIMPAMRLYRHKSRYPTGATPKTSPRRVKRCYFSVLSDNLEQFNLVVDYLDAHGYAKRRLKTPRKLDIAEDVHQVTYSVGTTRPELRAFEHCYGAVWATIPFKMSPEAREKHKIYTRKVDKRLEFAYLNDIF